MKLLIRNGTVIRPGEGPARRLDVLIAGARVVRIAPRIAASAGTTVLDAAGMLVVPGLVDVHVHFRVPGQEHKEDMLSGSRAAAAGGFTTVIAEPNTVPPIDSPARLRRLLATAQAKSLVNFFTKAAITRGQKGERLTDFGALKRAGATAVSDDGNPVPEGALMREALEAAARCRITASPHCEESHYYREQMRGRLPNAGRRTMPYCAEAEFIRRDLGLAAATRGARLHISHVSLAGSVRLIAAAKKRGEKVTAEVSPHHLLLTAGQVAKIGTNAKANPPLRSVRDVAAVRRALADGIIDIIASDHAPHSPSEKAKPWDEAPFGVIGLETTLGVVLTHLVSPGILPLDRAIEAMTSRPARIFGLDRLGIGRLEVGGRADVTVIDPDRKWKVDSSLFQSKSRNCPFEGWNLRGRAAATIVAGRIVARYGALVA